MTLDPTEMKIKAIGLSILVMIVLLCVYPLGAPVFPLVLALGMAFKYTERAGYGAADIRAVENTAFALVCLAWAMGFLLLLI